MEIRKMELVAHFVFDDGNQVDVGLNIDQKDDFFSALKDGKLFYEKDGNNGLYANLDRILFFSLSLASSPKPEEKSPSKERENFDEFK